MKLDVQLFARARDLAGADRVVLDLPEPSCVAELRTRLGENYPQLIPMLPSLLIAVDANYAGDETPLPVGCEVACFPPVSGG